MLTGAFPGRWWRPGDRSHAVAGVLSLAYDGLALDLIGSFGRLEEIGKVSAFPVLHGTSTDGHDFTLVNALVANETLSMRALDMPATRLLPGSVLVGAHLDDPVQTEWRVASVELERITAFAAPAGFEQAIEVTEDNRLRTFGIRYTVPDSAEAAIPGAVLRIGPSQRTVGDLVHEAAIKVSVEALFELRVPAQFEELTHRFVSPLLNLVILATQKATALTTVRVAIDPKRPREWVEVVQRRNAPAGGRLKRLLPMDALFLLPDLLDAAPDALAHWFGLWPALERPLELVSAVHATPGLFLDHRFINVATAAESYHEQRIGGRAMPDDAWDAIVSAAVTAAPRSLADQVRSRMAGMKSPSFRDRINGLLERGGSDLRELLPDPERVAARAAAIRNPLAHGNAARASHREIFDATDELLLILEFHFLCDAGFTREQSAARLRAASESYSGLWLRRRDDRT